MKSGEKFRLDPDYKPVPLPLPLPLQRGFLNILYTGDVFRGYIEQTSWLRGTDKVNENMVNQNSSIGKITIIMLPLI